jgi:hypothetical protein
VIRYFLATGIVPLLVENEEFLPKEQSMPVLSAQNHLFEAFLVQQLALPEFTLISEQVV